MEHKCQVPASVLLYLTDPKQPGTRLATVPLRVTKGPKVHIQAAAKKKRLLGWTKPSRVVP